MQSPKVESLASGGYRYPDSDDAITATYLRNREPYPGYWQLSEKRALAAAERVMPAGGKLNALDLGCGSGRLLPHLAHRYGHVTAIEPDAARAARARAVGDRLSNIEVLHGDIEAVRMRQQIFDVVICSHVIQHVPTDAVGPLFASVRAVLRSRGRLLLLIPKLGCTNTKFDATRLDGNRATTRPLDEAEFNSLATNRLEDELPTQRFSSQEIARLLDPFFLVVHERAYGDLHRIPFIDRVLFRDHILRFRPLCSYFGLNVSVVAIRRD